MPNNFRDRVAVDWSIQSDNLVDDKTQAEPGENVLHGVAGVLETQRTARPVTAATKIYLADT